MSDTIVTGFRDREDAALQLASRLKARGVHAPVVLAIPRGGVVIGAVLARELGGELDVALARKLRAPLQPEYAIGAISEDGQITLNPDACDVPGYSDGYLAQEAHHQRGEIARRRHLVRQTCPQAHVTGRTVVVTDDGIATGSTMIAALQAVRDRHPRELLVAVPVAPPDRLAQVARWCDGLICLIAPESFRAIGQFYDDFEQVEDEEMLSLLRDSRSRATSPGLPE